MRHRDFIQNIAITLLAVSALFLFSRTQFFQLGAASVGNYWQRITAPASSATDDVILSDTLSAPVRAAVTGEYGRYASVTLTTGEDRFIPIKPCCGRCLALPETAPIPHRPPFWRLWEKLRSTAIFSPPCRRPIWRI